MIASSVSWEVHVLSVSVCESGGLCSMLSYTLTGTDLWIVCPCLSCFREHDCLSVSRMLASWEHTVHVSFVTRVEWPLVLCCSMHTVPHRWLNLCALRVASLLIECSMLSCQLHDTSLLTQCSTLSCLLCAWRSLV